MSGLTIADAFDGFYVKKFIRIFLNESHDCDNNNFKCLNDYCLKITYSI